MLFLNQFIELRTVISGCGARLGYKEYNSPDLEVSNENFLFYIEMFVDAKACMTLVMWSLSF